MYFGQAKDMSGNGDRLSALNKNILLRNVTYMLNVPFYFEFPGRKSLQTVVLASKIAFFWRPVCYTFRTPNIHFGHPHVNIIWTGALSQYPCNGFLKRRLYHKILGVYM